jgi:uncharacterized membrane protein YgcG
MTFAHKTLIVILSFFAAVTLFAPLAASASVAQGIGLTGYWGPLVSCTGNYDSSTTVMPGAPSNACTSVCDLIGTFINVTYFAMSAALFILAPVLFVVGGIMFLMSGANPGMLEKAKKTLTSTLIGLLIVLCSYLLIYTFVKALNITGIGGFGTSACSVDGAAAPTDSTSVPVPSTSTPGPSQGGSSGGGGANFGGGSSGGGGASGGF